MSIRTRLALAAISVFAVSRPLPSANLHADASMVLVPTQVTGATGAAIADLHKEDFHIFEDGVEQAITNFALEDAPVSVGFLFDSSASMRNKMHQSSKAAAAFFDTANRGDEFFLISFNESAKLSIPFTTDTNEVYKRVSHVHPLGRTSLLDAIHLALVEMKRAQNVRKAIVIVSDGGDNRSRYTAAQIGHAVEETGVQIYSMGIFDPVEQRSRTSPEEKNGPQLLERLSQLSGGRYFSVDNLDDLPAIATRIGEDLRTQYLLGFSPANDAHNGAYHRIQVKLAPEAQSPDREIRYRRGYYSPAE